MEERRGGSGDGGHGRQREFFFFDFRTESERNEKPFNARFVCLACKSGPDVVE